MSETVKRRFLVSGKVQGVFFRASTRAEADSLGVSGWARNLPDGRVEVVAHGDADALEKLESWLWKGPPAAEVNAVDTDDYVGDIADGFKITS
ncbi:acylphosphatase [Gammaproteobacteria bacterium AB-CW1]|uniref:Acylphosphatase n=1 Tax=Natronospira elongata TaxID=3110268 RepID=A0AAP6MLM2_9GAMM|nr:acylphosphatase [Gammaproteobacteria bacterium AB-CW1]